MRIPGALGEMGVLYDHAPLLSTIIPGEVGYKIGKDEKCLCVGAGFTEVLNDRVTLLVDSAELAHEIDLARAEKAKEQAENKIKESLATEQEYFEADMALRKANARINVATKHESSHK